MRSRQLRCGENGLKVREQRMRGIAGCGCERPASGDHNVVGSGARQRSHHFCFWGFKVCWAEYSRNKKISASSRRRDLKQSHRRRTNRRAIAIIRQSCSDSLSREAPCLGLGYVENGDSKRHNHSEGLSSGKAGLPGVQNSTLSECFSKNSRSIITRMASGNRPSR